MGHYVVTYTAYDIFANQLFVGHTTMSVDVQNLGSGGFDAAFDVFCTGLKYSNLNVDTAIINAVFKL